MQINVYGQCREYLVKITEQIMEKKIKKIMAAPGETGCLPGHNCIEAIQAKRGHPSVVGVRSGRGMRMPGKGV